jgi:hypothetical protein
MSKLMSALWSCLMLSAVPSAALAQKAPAELIAVRDRLAVAALAGDAKAAAALTFFPFENAAYGGAPHLSKTEFMKKFKKDENWGNCLAKGNFVKDTRAKNAYHIECDQGNNIYYFGQRNGRWYYTGYENIGE